MEPDKGEIDKVRPQSDSKSVADGKTIPAHKKLSDAEIDSLNHEKLELENKKLQREIDLLNGTIKEKKKAQNKTTTVEEKIKTWSQILLVLGTLLSGLYGYFFHVQTFLDQRKKTQEIIYNQQLLNAASDLNDSNNYKQRKAMVILSASGLSALPFIFANLETTEDTAHLDKIYNGLSYLRERLKPAEQADFDNAIKNTSSHFLSLYLDSNTNKKRIYYFKELNAYSRIVKKFSDIGETVKSYVPFRDWARKQIAVQDSLIDAVAGNVSHHDDNLITTLSAN